MKFIEKRLANGQLLVLDPCSNKHTSKHFQCAFNSINADEPLSLQEFLLTLNERLKTENIYDALY